MEYLVSFLEGIITFISPCLLPMLPVYLTYFAGGGQRSGKRTLSGAMGFVLGFTLVFVAMGALAGTAGSFLTRHQTAVNIVAGLVVICFGLNYLGVFKLKLFRGGSSMGTVKPTGFFSTVLLGMVFSLGWTPCVGPFLGAALMQASQGGSTIHGIFMLLAYSLGLGIPFVLSALLIDRLKGAFHWIKSHYTLINRVCGILLVVLGVLMATGAFGYLSGLLS